MTKRKHAPVFLCRNPEPFAHANAQDRLLGSPVRAEPCLCEGVRLVDDGTCAKCGHITRAEIAETWSEAA